MARRIDQILEEENDDDELLMKELEELAAFKGEGQPPRHIETGVKSDGGNTSMDSMMEDTPSNYNAMNQRIQEQEQVKDRARQFRGSPVMEDEEWEEGSHYPEGRGFKKVRRKKKKKKAKPTDDVNYRDLMMAAAYGGLTQG